MTDSPGTPAEQELVRRLADLADTTTVDEGAWDAIQKRLTPVANPWARRSPWRLAVMAAAAVVLVVGAIAMSRNDDDGARVDIQEEEDKDKQTTTTSAPDDDEEVTETTTSDGTSTTIAPGIAGEGAQSGDGDGGTGTDPGGTDGGGGSRAGGGGPPGPGGGTSIPGTTEPPPTETEMPDGRLPAVSVGSGPSAISATLFTQQSNISMNIWRGPDEWLTNYLRADTPGQNCLAGEGMSFSGSGTFDWGIVRADAAEVRIVMTDGSWATASIGAQMVPGVRAWLGPRPAGTLDHYEARDGAGNVLHTATPPYADAQPDAC